MRTPARGYAARRPWFLRPSVVTAIVLLLVFGGLWATNVINPLRWFGPRAPSTRGLVPVPISAMVIPSYTRVTRDHLWDVKQHKLSVLYLRPDQVSSDMIASINGIVGRVMDHDKPAGYVFTESDFLPKGTRPGLVAGIPPNKRAMRVTLDKIPGLAGLLPGDRFDLVSTLPIEVGPGAGLAAGGVYGKQLDLQARMTNWQRQATVRVVVQNGDIVQPVTTRQVPVANTTLTQGLVVRTRPIQEVVIAVLPHEVAPLSEALAVGATISCVPRSGRPDDSPYTVTPESRPWSPFGGVVQQPAGTESASAPGAVNGSTPSVPGLLPVGAGFTQVETISGSKRELVAAPVKK